MEKCTILATIMLLQLMMINSMLTGNSNVAEDCAKAEGDNNHYDGICSTCSCFKVGGKIGKTCLFCYPSCSKSYAPRIGKIK